jgi:uncharacterized protein (DUF1697 family)
MSTVKILLLRGINIGPNKRIAMPELRALLGDAGFEDVRTYVQSGNVVMSARGAADKVARKCERVIADAFGLKIDVVARTRDELAQVVERDPLGEVARDPKRYLVSFLSAEPGPEVLDGLQVLKAEPEELVLIGREFYSWHPSGVGRSKLWAKMAARGLGVTATARNWTTVTTLLAMADG